MSLPHVHLSPGQLLVTREPQIVVTVLGSCVAVTMFDATSGLAAICHAMLAQPQATEDARLAADRPYRFVSRAVPAMLDAYRRAGVPLRRIQVKLFGGGNVIAHAASPFGSAAIGPANIGVARDLIECARLSITAENTGGRTGRKILFNTATGEVLHKHLRSEAA